MHDIATHQTMSQLTLQAEAVELAGDVGDEALGMSEEAKFGNEVTDHAVEGFIISFNRLWPQHVLPQETSHCLPFLPLTGQTHRRKHKHLSIHPKILFNVFRWGYLATALKQLFAQYLIPM